MIRILTKNGVDNTNVDGARDHNFNAGRRSGIVQGALNQGNFFASNNNTIALDTCELRLCGHRIVLDQAEYRTFTNKPSVPVRYSFVARVVVDSDYNVSFEFVSQEATTQLVQDNLDITGSGTYELEIGRFTQLTDGTITDVVRTADLITGGAGGGDSEYIRIGTVTTNKISPELDADVDIENTINPDDNKPQTNFTFNLPTPSGTVVSLNGVEKTSMNTDTTPTANSQNLVTSGGVHDYPAIAFAESERQKSKNLCGLIDFEQTINGVTIKLISSSQTVILNGTATSTFDAMTTVRNMLPYVSNMQGEDLKVTAYYLSGTKSDTAIAFISTVDNDDVFGDRSAGISLPDNNLTSINFSPSKNSTYNTLMLYTVNGASFTNYAFRIQIEKGQVTNWEYPHGQITHNGDKEIVFAESERQKSKNLLDKNLLKKGCYIFVTGKYDYNTSYMTFEPISVTPNSTITISCNGFIFNSDCGFVFFNNGVFVDYLSNGATVATVPANANQVIYNFLKVGITKDDVQYAQLEYGSVATDYQPYNGQITHNGDTAVEFAEKEYQKSKNLIPYPYYDGNSIVSNGITFTVNNDQSISVSGTIIDHNSNAVMWLAWDMPLKAGTYRISDSNSSNDLSVVAWIGNDYYQKDVNNGMFTLSSDTTARIYLQVAKGSTKTYNDTIRFMLCEGTDTDWQPYNGPILHKSEVEPVLIYDKDTKNTIGGTAYRDGIGDGNTAIYTINNIDLTPYKYMYVYQRMFGEIQKIFVDLTNSVEAGGYCGGQTTMSYNIDALDCSLVKVPTTKDSITFNARYIRLSDVSLQSTPVNVCRIEGYK